MRLAILRRCSNSMLAPGMNPRPFHPTRRPCPCRCREGHAIHGARVIVGLQNNSFDHGIEKRWRMTVGIGSSRRSSTMESAAAKSSPMSDEEIAEMVNVRILRDDMLLTYPAYSSFRMLIRYSCLFLFHNYDLHLTSRNTEARVVHPHRWKHC